MQVYVAQILGIILLFSVTTFVGVLPSWLISRGGDDWCESKAFHWVMSIANSLASGVFMEICFLSLIPLVQAEFNSLWHELSIDLHYPLGEALILIGFFLILAIENAALWMHQRDNKSNMGMRTLSVRDVTAELGNHTESGACTISTPRMICDRVDDEGAPLNRTPHGSRKNSVTAACNDHHSTSTSAVAVAVAAAPSPNPAPSSHNHCHGAVVLDDTGSRLRFIMLLAAISVHSLLEGMAVGLQDSVPLVINLFVGILIHETLVALAIGIKVAQRTSGVCRALRMVCAFTLMIPLGIGIGVGLGSTEGAVGHAVSGVSQALAAGVFLHVTFMELVPEELRRSKNAFVSIFCMLIGFMTMSVIAYFVEHTH